MTPSLQLAAMGLDHVFLLLFALVSLYLLSNRYQRRLDRIPGPLLSSTSSIPRILSVSRSKSHETDIRLHRKYGKIVRVAPNTLSISDPDEINTLYGISTKFFKSPFYLLSSAHDEEGLVPDPFVLTDKSLHSRMKRNAANAYSMNGLVQMESWVEPVTNRLVCILEDQYIDSKKPCDLGNLLKNYAMDAIFALTFGKDLNYLENGDTKNLMKIVDTISDYMAIVSIPSNADGNLPPRPTTDELWQFGQIAWCHPFLLGNKLGQRLILGADASQDDIINLASEQVAETRDSAGDGPLTFLQRLLLNQRENPKSLNDREIFTHAFGNISAGSDTTAIALRSVFIHLLKFPHTYRKLCDEVRTKLVLPVSFSKANELPYLGAVIREAMRIHPSVGMMLVRIVPSGGALLCGHHVRAGTEVGISPWVLHRDPQVFPSPDDFVPERWLTKDEEHLKLMSRGSYMQW